MSDFSTVVAADQAPLLPATNAAAAPGHKLPTIGGRRCQILDAALRRASTIQSASQDGHWVIRTPGLQRVTNVDLSSEWLSISLPLRRLSRSISIGIIAAQLSRNARIAGGARIVAQRRPGGREVVADFPVEMLPWDDAAEFQRVLDATLAELDGALGADIQPSASSSQAGLSREQFAANLDEAGWSGQPGEGDRLEVPLDVPGNYFVATVDRSGLSVRLSVPILAAELAVAPVVCRSAVAVLLWLTASRVRMAKPRRTRRALAVEISLPSGHCNAIALAHGCAALSVVLQQCAAEAAQLVASQELAQRYLANLGFPESP